VNIQGVLNYLAENFSSDLERVREFLRTPSVSYTGEGIYETAQNVKHMIEEIGGYAELVNTPGHPVVYGEIIDNNEHTLLIYGMYDVMPTDEPGWTVDPWAAEIKNLPKFGPSIINRGAVNTKGPLAAFFNTLRAFKRVEGKLPVNLIFAIEGEEEWGSRHFPGFIEQYKDKLSKAEAVLFPFFSQDESDTPGLTLGTKGLLYFELICRGGDWGGPTSRAIHGSYNVWVKNPAWRLVKALSTMVDENENILIENFFDRVSPLCPEDRDRLEQQIAKGRFDERVFREAYDVKKLKYEGSGIEVWEKLYSQPQLNIDGIESGYTGPETKTLLPHIASVKVDVRMVPHMDPDEIVSLIREHLDRHGFSDIEMKVHHKYYWSKVSINEKVVQAMIETYRNMGHDPRIEPLNPGSAPYYVFEQYLHIPYVTGGMGHGSRQHSSDEYCTVQGILDFEKSMALFFHNYLKNV
jgi:acetylornithine deacetylase/succinyl-diaminopimelate desuccinylase-like protein